MNSILFYKAMSGFYDLIDVTYFRDYDRSPRKVVLKAINETDKVLDLCTGTATNALKIAKANPHAKVVGVDLSKDMLRVAKAKAKKANVLNLKLRCEDATSLTFKDNCFDKVLISLVLHETEDDLADKILAEARRVLKPDGELIVTEWETSTQPLQRILFFPIACLEPAPFKSFIKKNLHKYFRQHGFISLQESHCAYSRVLRLRKL